MLLFACIIAANSPDGVTSDNSSAVTTSGLSNQVVKIDGDDEHKDLVVQCQW